MRGEFECGARMESCLLVADDVVGDAIEDYRGVRVEVTGHNITWQSIGYMRRRHGHEH